MLKTNNLFFIFGKIETQKLLALTKKRNFIAGLLMLCALPSAHAYTFQSGPETDTTKKIQPIDLGSISLTDDPFVARLDSLLNFSFFISDSSVASTEAFIDTEGVSRPNTTDFADSVYKERLARLNEATPFDLTYSPQVRRYIDMYGQRKSEQVSRMLGLASYYFPLFEEELDRYGLPLELKYLAIVESALNPNARSRVGATGLWQFMYSTARLNGLSITSYVDERNDPLKSTEAACKYLRTLYNIFGDWNLALAAYNSGPGNVNKAIRRSGGKRNYWEIRPYLPRETAGYVPAFIAVNYIMNYATEHHIYPKDVKPSYFQTDTISIKEKISFDQISKLMDVSEEELEFLNPAYRYKVIPKNSDNPYQLILPAQKMGMFIANEDSIYALARQDFEQNEPSLPAPVVMNNKIYHRVRRGEVLGTIAEHYGVSVSSIRRWNGLRGNTIRIGQRLAIYPHRLPQNTTASTQSSDKRSSNGEYLMHSVRSGETFYSIAKKYPGISAENIMDWNNIRNARSLKVGMHLKIYPNS